MTPNPVPGRPEDAAEPVIDDAGGASNSHAVVGRTGGSIPPTGANACTCAQCADCLLAALAEKPDAIDRICAEPNERLTPLRPQIIERLRRDRTTWRAKKEEKDT